MEEDNNVYVKKGRKYVPFGMRYNENYLPDGIWFVHHDECSCGHTNVDHYMSGLFKVGDKPELTDVPQLCKKYTYADYILSHPEFKEAIEKPISIHDIVCKVVALIFDLNKSVEEYKDDDN